ncbi:MAG: hypothetical protein K0U59_02425 [Gammaproteobacteria bacterium]|nr:hypothetical protein [Gammaproteobacteria bacterium]
MTTIPCQLFQRVHLAGLFTIEPVSIDNGVIQLQISECEAGRLLRCEQFIEAMSEVWALEYNQTDQALSDNEAPEHPGDDSESLH